AIASPIPREAPVTIAAFPERRFASVIRSLAAILSAGRSSAARRVPNGARDNLATVLAPVAEIERALQAAFRAVGLAGLGRTRAGVARAPLGGLSRLRGLRV